MRERGHAAVNRSVPQDPEQGAGLGMADARLSERRRRPGAFAFRSMAACALTPVEFSTRANGRLLTGEGILRGSDRCWSPIDGSAVLRAHETAAEQQRKRESHFEPRRNSRAN